jgi:C-terminal processing protease CtpA/Prc
MYLRKNKKYKMAFEYNMSGLDFEAMPPRYNEFIINYVREGSQAEQAGIQVGDQILMLNGLQVRNMKMGDVFNMLSTKSGRKIRIKVRRGEETLSFKFRLERLI